MLELLRHHHPTVCPIVPAICDAISNLIESEKRDPAKTARKIDGLRLCISGAAPLSRATAERFQKLTGAVVIEGYGLTEAAPVTHACLPNLVRAGSIGLPLPDTRVRIADLTDVKRDAPAGEPGELLICGPQVMAGYFANPEQSQNALITDHKGDVWLRTGDVVRTDADGWFYVLDRKKDMIIRSGMKIYPGRVEHVLRRHAAVKDVAVVGRPDAVHTELPVAVIAPAPPEEQRHKLADELRALCREHLAPYEVPASIEFMNELPRSALGKLLKRELRKGPTPEGKHEDPLALPKLQSDFPVAQETAREPIREPSGSAAGHSATGADAKGSNGHAQSFEFRRSSDLQDANGKPTISGNGNGHARV